ncbi:hypothetical protein QEN19_000527 [Hanseniaspora menglaensis]
MFSSFASTLSTATSSSYKIDASYSYGNLIIPNYLGFWQVYEGASKKTGLKVCIFKFEKKIFEAHIRNKVIIKESYEKIALDVANIQKIKHPSFLNIIEPLEIHSKSFIFVSESISTNLKLKYGNDTMYTINNTGNKQNNSIVIKKGLYELSKALDFVHNKMKKVILNINPENIFIDSKGNWKVASLVGMQSNTDTYYDINYANEYEYGSNINYMAPELFFENKFNCSSDYFSLGLLVYFLIYGNDLIKTENQSIEIYKLEYKKLESKTLKIGYKNLFPLLVMNEKDFFFIRFLNNVLNKDYHMRCESLIDWINDEFNSNDGNKDNELIKTLLFIEKGEFYSVNFKSQVIFLNGLSKIWREYDHHILLNNVVALLLEIITLNIGEKQKEETDLEFFKLTINLLLDISFEVLTIEEFSTRIFMQLSFDKLMIINPVFEILLQRINVFQTKLESKQFLGLLNDVFFKKIIKTELVSTPDNAGLQSSLLSTEFIKTLSQCAEFELTKNFTDPILLKIFSNTQSLKIKLACLDAIDELISMEKINKYQMSDSILKIIENNKTTNVKITMSILQLITKLVQSDQFYVNEKNILLDRILPLLWRLSMTPNLNLSEFGKCQNIINYTTRRIQDLHISFIKSTAVNMPGPSTVMNKNSFHDIVQKVDISKSTNQFTGIEQKELQKLNRSAQIIKPKNDIKISSSVIQKRDMSLKNDNHSYTGPNSSNIMVPNNKNLDHNSINGISVLQPKLKK